MKKQETKFMYEWSQLITQCLGKRLNGKCSSSSHWGMRFITDLLGYLIIY